MFTRQHGRAVRFDDVVRAAPVWSHTCGWADLAESAATWPAVAEQLDLAAGWSTRWTATCRLGGGELVVPARDAATLPVAGREPVRRFGWHRAQRHRPGLEYLVSTGRHHGYESLAEARLLRMLDFAGGLGDVLAQPMRIGFLTEDGPRQHVPDFLAWGESGRWLVDVRPAGRIGVRDEIAFAATAEVASVAGWAYRVVTDWKPHVWSTVDALAAQRRPLTDRLGLLDELLAALRDGPRTFGDLTGGTRTPVMARAYLLHLLWHRRVGMDLSLPLTDRTPITTSREGGTR